MKYFFRLLVSFTFCIILSALVSRSYAADCTSILQTNIPDEFGATPLHCLADQDTSEFSKIQMAELKTLLDAKVNVNAIASQYIYDWTHRSPRGLYAFSKATALHIAIQHSSVEFIQALVNAGADVNQSILTYNEGSNLWGDSPLMMAVYGGRFDVVRFLIAAGANPKALNFDGASLLHYLIGINSIPEDILSLLGQSKLDFNTKDREGDSPLHWAASFRLIPPEALMFFAKNCANPFLKNLENQTPYEYAKKRGSALVMKQLTDYEKNYKLRCLL